MELSVSLKKSKYLDANSEAKCEVLINVVIEIDQEDSFKYPGAIVSKMELVKQN